MNIARMLVSWYRNYTMQVKQGASFSDPFTTTSGARETYCSPWWAAGHSVNIMHYGKYGCESLNIRWEFMCVLSLFSGIQCCLNISCDYALEHENVCNCNKTVGAAFHRERLIACRTSCFPGVSAKLYGESEISWCITSCLIEGCQWCAKAGETSSEVFLISALGYSS